MKAIRAAREEDRAAARKHATATTKEEEEGTKGGEQAQSEEPRSRKNPSQANSQRVGPDSIPPAPRYVYHIGRHVSRQRY